MSTQALLAIALLAASSAAAAPCCLSLACTDLAPADCAAGGGVSGFCRAGDPCGAAICDGSVIAPIAAVRLVKDGADVAFAWSPDGNAGGYEVRFVADKRGIPDAVPGGASSSPVPGSAPTTIAAALHAGAVAGPPGEALFYVVFGRCTTNPAAGSCCLLSIVCAPISPLECMASGGWYRPTDTCACPCEGPPAACCMPQGTCETNIPGCCESRGGIADLSGACAAGFHCTCCLSGTCAVRTETDCRQQGGTPLVCTPGTSC